MVNLSNQAERQRETFPEPLHAVRQGGDVVRYFPDVIPRDSWDALVLEQEQVGKRGLRPLDLRGEDRFLADVHVEHQ